MSDLSRACGDAARSALRRSLAIALLAIATLGCGDAPRPLPDLVLVSWDTVRADHVGALASERREPSHTPTFDRLARGGGLFLEARTPVPITLPAHASMLTGLFPARHGARNNGVFRVRPGLPSLATQLGSAGYRTAAFVSSAVLDQRYGLSEGFDVYDDEMSSPGPGGAMNQRIGGETVDAAVAWLRSAPLDEPVFIWLHLFDPHRSWMAPAPFAERFDPYRAEIAFSDFQTKRLLDALEERGRLDETVVVIASDHGEGLGEHGEGSHAYFIYESTARVPLLFWAGESLSFGWNRGARIAGPASLVDIAPTVLDLAGVSVFRADGRSLVPQLAAGTAVPPRLHPLECVAPALDYGTAPVFGVVDEAGNAWYDLPRRERYLLDVDPRETRNVYSEADATTADALFSQMDWGWPQEDARLAVDEDTREQLAALGYLSGVARDGSEEDGTPGGLIDPKDRVELFDLLNLGHIQMGPARALAKTEELRARHGSLPALDRFELGMLDSLGRSRDALDVLERLASRSDGDANPYSEQLAARRAAYKKQEQLAGAIRRAKADGSAPPSAEADLALTLHRLQSWPEAEMHYRAALARSPEQADLRKNLVRLLMGADRPEEALEIAQEGRIIDPKNASLSCLAGRILAIHLRRGREAEAAYADCRGQGGQPSVYEIEVLSLLGGDG